MAVQAKNVYTSEVINSNSSGANLPPCWNRVNVLAIWVLEGYKHIMSALCIMPSLHNIEICVGIPVILF